MWTPPNLHDAAESVEVYICRPAESNYLWFDDPDGPELDDDVLFFKRCEVALGA